MSASLPLLLSDALARTGAAPALRWKRFGLWHPVSGADLLGRARAVAGGLRGLGVAPGETTAIYAGNCAEWAIADLGALFAGCVSAGLDAHSDAADLARLVEATQARVLFVEGERRLRVAAAVRSKSATLRHVVDLRSEWRADDGLGDVLMFADLEAAAPADLSSAAADPAIYLCTSGVTGPARAVAASHALVCAQIARARDAFGLGAGDDRLALAPLHHVLERVSGLYAALASGCVVDFAESADTAFADLAELQPSVVQAPPRLWSAMRTRVELDLAEATALQRAAFAAAQRAQGRGRLSPWGALLDRLALRPIRRRLGVDGARLALSAGAPAHPATVDWLRRLGVALTDVYGLAEAGGAVAVTAPSAASLSLLPGFRATTCGRGGVSIEAPELGRVATGDRVAATGTGVSPPRGRLTDAPEGVDFFPAEEALRASPYVADAFLAKHGERVVAHVLLDFERAAKFAQDHGVPFTHMKSLSEAPEIRALVERAVEEANRSPTTARIDGVELITRMMGPGDPDLSPAMALRRYRFEAAAPARKTAAHV